MGKLSVTWISSTFWHRSHSVLQRKSSRLNPCFRDSESHYLNFLLTLISHLRSFLIGRVKENLQMLHAFTIHISVFFMLNSIRTKYQKNHDLTSARFPALGTGLVFLPVSVLFESHDLNRPDVIWPSVKHTCT